MSMEFSAGESHEEVSELRSEHNHRGVDEEIENRIEQSSFFKFVGTTMTTIHLCPNPSRSRLLLETNNES